MGIFGVCAEPQPNVDKAMKDWELKFTVSQCWLARLVWENAGFDIKEAILFVVMSF